MDISQIGTQQLGQISSGLGGINQLASGISRFASLRQLAAIREDEAELLEEFGRRAAADELRRGTRLEGRQIGAFAAGGVDVGSGTALQVRQAGRSRTARNASRAQERFDIAAINREEEARSARRASILSLFSGLAGGSTEALGIFQGMDEEDPFEGLEVGGVTDVRTTTPPRITGSTRVPT